MTGAARKRIVAWLVGVNVLVLLLNWIVAGPAWSVVDWEARRRAVRAIGEARRYDISIHASLLDLIEGIVPAEEIRGTDVHLHNGLTVSSFTVQIHGLRTSSSEITELESVAFTARLSQEAINAYLPVRPRRSRLEPDVRLGLSAKQVDLDGTQGVAGIGVGFHAGGTLELRDKTRLYFHLDEANISRVHLSRQKLAWITDLINPIVNFDDLGFGIEVTQFRVVDGAIEVAGTARPPLPFPLARADASPSP